MMIVTDSEIWHTYSTYILGAIDLNTAGRLLVESGLAFCTMHRDGQTYWKTKDGIRSGVTEIDINEKGDRASISAKPHDATDPDYVDFAQEAWYQAAYLRFGEIRLFGDDYSAPPPYIRAFLGECELIRTESDQTIVTTCYPIIKLYESGVLIVEMRTKLAGRKTTIRDFIDEYLNIRTKRFSLIRVPAALSKIAPRTYESYARPTKSIKSRFSVWVMEAGHDEAVHQLTEIKKAGDFEFDTAPLPSSLEPGEHESLLSLVLTIFEVVSFTISEPRKGLRLLFFGQRKLYKRGGYWQGRPHVHILSYEDQGETAADNEATHRDSLNQIFLSTSAKAGANADALPPNARLFEDYGAYIAPQATVWIWAKQGIDRESEWQDPNRGHLVYPNQTCAEMLEYGYMVHRSLMESIRTASTSQDVIEIRRAVLDLRSRLRQSSHFGEVAKLLDNGWRAMGLDELRNDIAEGLAIRESETRSQEANAAESISRILTVVFGMIAVPTLADEVVAPLWDLLGMWRPHNPNTARLFMIAVASLPVIALTVAISNWFKKR
jgi:hypothetical protein